MIHEFFLYLTEKKDRRAVKFGHLKESIALIKREKRCHQYWLPHQNNCKNLILKIVNSLPKKNRILVLGSGPLHEIPVNELSSIFSEVVLVDIVHLNIVKNAYSYLKNVTFIEHDISEVEDQILKQKRLENKPPMRFLDEDFDLVVSANLLSQIPYHLKKFAQKNLSYISEDDIDNFCFQISVDHFSYLKKFNCPVLLYTDIETHIFHPKKNVLEIETPYINFSLPTSHSEWIWNLAPTPEINPEISLQMKVVSIILNA